jgi:putative DNA primase/helicase
MVPTKISDGSELVQRSPDMLAAALDLAARGYRVFPIHEPRATGESPTCSCGDLTCRSVGKHPRTRNGAKDATTDAGQVHAWWAKTPHASIGIATGDGLHVLDVDGDMGRETLRAVYGIDLDALLATTPSATTGREGGHHFFFDAPSGPAMKSVAGRLGAKLDERGDGGYVVAAPSLHRSGARYTWQTDLDTPRAPWPDAFQMMQEGERSDRLGSMIGWWFHTGLSEPEVLSRAFAYNARYGNPAQDEREVETHVASIGERERKSGGANLAAIYSDAGNGARLATAVYGHLKVCLPLGATYAFNKQHWVRDVKGDPLARTVAKEFVDRELREAGAALADRTRQNAEQQITHLLRLKYEARFAPMVKNMKDDPIVRVEPRDFDRHPHLLNVEDGTLNLDTLVLQPFNPDDLLTGKLAVRYVPAAHADIWVQHIRYLASAPDGTPRPELERYYWRALGYTLRGGNPERKLFFLKGRTTAGKSKLLEGLRALFGPYAGSLGFDSLLKKGKYGSGGDSARSDIAALMGKRFVTAAEPNIDGEFDTALLKQLTGGDQIAARHLYHEAVPFVFTGTLWLAANAPPKIAADDDATWVRMSVIPVEFTLPPEKRDDDILRKLTTPEALTGLLAMMIDGLREVQRDGLRPPPLVTGATKTYRDDNNIVAQFIEECYEVTEPRRKSTPGMPHVPLAEVFTRYQWYCDRGQVPQLYGSTRSFTEALQNLEPSFEVTKGTGNKTYVYGVKARLDRGTATGGIDEIM